TGWQIAGAMWSPAGALVGIALTTLGVVAVARRHWAISAGAVGYTAMIAVFPFAPDRYIWGVLPLTALCTAAGAGAAWQWLQARQIGRARRPIVPVAFLLLCVLPLLVLMHRTVIGYRAQGWIVPQVRELRAARPVVAFVRRIPRADPVASGNNALVALAAGR